MVKFDLYVERVSGPREPYTEERLERAFELAYLPRLGEEISIQSLERDPDPSCVYATVRNVRYRSDGGITLMATIPDWQWELVEDSTKWVAYRFEP